MGGNDEKIVVQFTQSDGSIREVEGAAGETLMRAALNGMVSGVLAECGGACICATCHVIVNPDWAGKLPPMAKDEEDMLEGAIDVTEHSRLSCQIVLTPELNGLKVNVPEDQI